MKPRLRVGRHPSLPWRGDLGVLGEGVAAFIRCSVSVLYHGRRRVPQKRIVMVSRVIEWCGLWLSAPPGEGAAQPAVDYRWAL